MAIPYTAPGFEKTAFNCPFCNAYAKFSWAYCIIDGQGRGYKAANCSHCDGWVMWVVNEQNRRKSLLAIPKMVYPALLTSPLPSPDMPVGCRADYDEARKVRPDSPRAAAALLRLAVQKLCQHLGEPGKNLNDDIGNLVKKGLDQRIQKALDIVRVTGNNAVHPGEMNIEDKPEAVEKLFKLVNTIVDEMITKPRELDALYGALPEGAKDAVQRRDGSAEPDGR